MQSVICRPDQGVVHLKPTTGLRRSRLTKIHNVFHRSDQGQLSTFRKLSTCAVTVIGVGVCNAVLLRNHLWQLSAVSA